MDGRKQYLLTNENDPRLMQYVQRRDKCFVVDPKYEDMLKPEPSNMPGETSESGAEAPKALAEVSGAEG